MRFRVFFSESVVSCVEVAYVGSLLVVHSGGCFGVCSSTEDKLIKSPKTN